MFFKNLKPHWPIDRLTKWPIEGPRRSFKKLQLGQRTNILTKLLLELIIAAKNIILIEMISSLLVIPRIIASCLQFSFPFSRLQAFLPASLWFFSMTASPSSYLTHPTDQPQVWQGLPLLPDQTLWGCVRLARHEHVQTSWLLQTCGRHASHFGAVLGRQQQGGAGPDTGWGRLHWLLCRVFSVRHREPTSSDVDKWLRFNR